jgi:FHS family L-fucose permease-like MFS transporter
MKLDIAPASSSDPVPLDETACESVNAPDLRLLVFALFFVFGGITSLNDVVIPKLKALFTLSYAEAMLVQSAFFAAYLLISLPAAAIIRRVGYLRAAVIGLSTMALGCLLFVPASSFGLFVAFLLALFVLASGITIVQVVANPLISMLGAPATAHSRLTFAQAFNSLGTTVFPFVGSILILRSLKEYDPAALTGAALDAFRVQESRTIVLTYLGLAAALSAMALTVWARRNRLPGRQAAQEPIWHAFGLLRQARFGFGALAIFLYVGAEVAIGSVIVNFLMQPDVLGLAPGAAGARVPLYWGGAMIGRFVGAYLLRIFSPGKVLASAAAAVIILLAVAGTYTGALSGGALLAIGLFNSIMFPTIFALASEGLGRRAHEGSGIICVAITGGAIVPLVTGHAADVAGLKAALAVPAACYAGIVSFGIYARRPFSARSNAIRSAARDRSRPARPA